MTQLTAAFPGGTSVSRLSVYDGVCDDGLVGGTPHLHTASTEGYVVVGGHGALHTVNMSGFREIPLETGSTVWFTPGTIHRAVNHDGLQVVVVMQNAGLPEAGDAVMTFPPDVVGDVERYRQAASLPLDAGEDEIAEAVRRRRNLAVEGYTRIVEGVRRGDFQPLDQLYASAVGLVREAAARWRRIWEDTVVRTTDATDDALRALEQGDGSHLKSAEVLSSPQSQAARWGMCGRLRTHDVANPDTP